MIQYMHGARVYLPSKIPFFMKLCLEMQADVIAFAYRGFTHSDGPKTCTKGIALDIKAIGKFFDTAVVAER